VSWFRRVVVWPLNSEFRVQSQASLRGIYGEQSDSRAELSSEYFDFTLSYLSTSSPYSFKYESPTLYNIMNWLPHWIRHFVRSLTILGSNPDEELAKLLMFLWILHFSKPDAGLEVTCVVLRCVIGNCYEFNWFMCPSHYGLRTDKMCKSNKYFIFWKCVCNVGYPACKAHAPYYNAVWVLSGYTTFFHIILVKEIFSEKYCGM
jgi:hypothetical protein